LLNEELRKQFGAGQVFMDVDSIDVGVDFADAINQAVSVCGVLLALVGPRWLTATDVSGSRRLDDPDDTVRVEIEAALNRSIRVIPVLIDGALMPRRQELPKTLAPLARRNALELSHNRYAYDLGRLLEAVERVLGQQSAPVADTANATPAPPPSEATGVGSQEATQLVKQAVPAIDTGRYEDALRDLDRSLELAPDNAWALKVRGDTYRALGRYEDALRDLDRSLELAPDDAFALRTRGNTYRALGR
jgi:tetratricopeptide (TPR) repeat protein